MSSRDANDYLGDRFERSIELLHKQGNTVCDPGPLLWGPRCLEGGHKPLNLTADGSTEDAAFKSHQLYCPAKASEAAFSTVSLWLPGGVPAASSIRHLPVCSSKRCVGKERGNEGRRRAAHAN
jgi:hypothetical protein